MTTQDKLIAIVRKFSKISGSDINISTGIKDLKFDSLDLLEFQMEIDDQFGIEIEIEEFLKCSNVDDLIALVKKYADPK